MWIYFSSLWLKTGGSVGAADNEILFVLRVRRSRFLAHFGDAGETRAAFEEGSQFAELLRSAHDKDFDAAIAEISHVAPDFNFGGGALREITKAHALNGAGDQILSGLFWLIHERENCSRERGWEKKPLGVTRSFLRVHCLEISGFFVYCVALCLESELVLTGVRRGGGV
jgi:hypothetical protein